MMRVALRDIPASVGAPKRFTDHQHDAPGGPLIQAPPDAELRLLRGVGSIMVSVAVHYQMAI
jgi:hypothetical protein